eukprot:4413082-Amphidinium_carterae.1
MMICQDNAPSRACQSGESLFIGWDVAASREVRKEPQRPTLSSECVYMLLHALVANAEELDGVLEPLFQPRSYMSVLR